MSEKEYRVNVYASEEAARQDGDAIARVRYNTLLDYWNGSNWQNGGVGRHKGITRLKSGNFAIIIGTQWQGEKDYAYVVSPEDALQEILRAQKMELLKLKRFGALRRLYDALYSDNEDLEDEEWER